MNGKKALILVVDDSPDMREILSLNLNKSGFEVVTAENGQEALTKLKTIKPDLILLDVEMPIMNGAETLINLKADPATKDLKVVFLTNYGESQDSIGHVDQKFAIEAGALCYLRKTDDMSNIMKEIEKHATATADINS